MGAGVSIGRMSAGRELDLGARLFSGARAHRAVHTGAMELAEHRHDWPCLAVHLLGRYRERNEAGELAIDGPAVMLHGMGEHHGERFEAGGAEVLILSFDPDWLGGDGWAARLKRTRAWTGGGIGVRSRALAELWLDPSADEADLRRTTAAFLHDALAAEHLPRPGWLPEVMDWIRGPVALRTPDIARSLGLHPAWLARAYRSCVGEGLRDTQRRVRAEQAIALLRATDLPLAEVALEAGFCDQSHLNRALRTLAGRTPVEIRAERDGFS